MANTRHKDAVWGIGEHPTLDQAQLGLLMDIRDELKLSNQRLATLVNLAQCYRIPRALDALESMT